MEPFVPGWNDEKSEKDPARVQRREKHRLRNRSFLLIILLILVGTGAAFFAVTKGIPPLPPFLLRHLPPEILDQLPLAEGPLVEVPFVPLGKDLNKNGIDDALDIVEGARLQVEARPRYKSEYYSGGYPPDAEGVCTDLIWRALKYAGYNLKEAVDKDIAENKREYRRVTEPDPNIDFRRVPNLFVFFKRNYQVLTNVLKPGDSENLKEWQPGDIVVLGRNHDHIGIVSDKRRRDGVPLIIHHVSLYPSEDDALRHWPITGHFRLKP